MEVAAVFKTPTLGDTIVKLLSHPDEFGYTEEGFNDWMRKNNPPSAAAEYYNKKYREEALKNQTRKYLRPYLNDPIVVDVLEKIKTRADKGMEKYGVPMTREDIDTVGWLRHAQEEALDLAIYLERIIRDLK